MNAASNGDPPQLWESRRSRPTLLVVEDDVVARFAVCGVLRDAGYTVLEAASADEATAILHTVTVDLLFVDVHLQAREGDGLAVVRSARERQPWVKVVFTSGKVPPDQVPEIAGLGPFLPKPYLFARVIQVVGQTLAEPGGPLD